MGLGKEMGGCGAFMKYALFFSNIVILIGGLIVLGIGVWTLVAKAFVTELLGTNLFLGAVYILIGTGIIVTLISCFGCLGAAKEIKCMLLVYFIIVFILFIILLVGGILGYVFREKVQYTMQQEMYNAIRSYGQVREITRAWDDTQSTLRCCGVYRYSDWQGNVPGSCCRTPEYGRSSFYQPGGFQSQGFQNQGFQTGGFQNQGFQGSSFPNSGFQGSSGGFQGGYQGASCNVDPNFPANIYQNGCLNATAYFVRDHASVLGGAGIGVACLMLLGMIFSCALFLQIE